MQASAARSAARGPVPMFFALLLFIGAGPAWCGCLHAVATGPSHSLVEVPQASQCHGDTDNPVAGEPVAQAMAHCPECAGYASAADAAPVSKLPAQGADAPALALATAFAPLLIYAKVRSLPLSGRAPPLLKRPTGVTLHTLMLD